MADSKKFRVVGIGEVLWDIYRDQRFLGGSPANFVIHAQQLGDEGIIVSRIGHDGMGDELVRALQARNIAADYLQVDKKKGTGTVVIQLDVRGVPSFSCTDDVAFDYLQFTPEDAKLAMSADAVMFGSLAQRSDAARAAIRQFLQKVRGIKLFDLNARSRDGRFQSMVVESLQLADMLKANEREVKFIMKLFRREGEKISTFCRYLMETYNLRLAVITREHEGAVVITADDIVMSKGFPVKVVDTTGAGDAFAAGFLHKYLRQATLQDAVDFANRLAAFVCTQRGATPEFAPENLP